MHDLITANDTDTTSLSSDEVVINEPLLIRLQRRARVLLEHLELVGTQIENGSSIESFLVLHPDVVDRVAQLRKKILSYFPEASLKIDLEASSSGKLSNGSLCIYIETASDVHGTRATFSKFLSDDDVFKFLDDSLVNVVTRYL